MEEYGPVNRSDEKHSGRLEGPSSRLHATVPDAESLRRRKQSGTTIDAMTNSRAAHLSKNEVVKLATTRAEAERSVVTPEVLAWLNPERTRSW